MNKYETIVPIEKSIAEQMFSTNDVVKICSALVAVSLYEPDWKWAQDKCLQLFKDTNSDISGLAATCLGHIARVHGRLEKEKVMNLLMTRLNEAGICGQIEDALADIKMFAIST